MIFWVVKCTWDIGFRNMVSFVTEQYIVTNTLLTCIFWAEIAFAFTSEKWVSNLEQSYGYKKDFSCSILIAEELTTFQIPLKYLKRLKYLCIATMNQRLPDGDWLWSAHTNRETKTMSKHACWCCAKNGWRPVVVKPNASLKLFHRNSITN
jgi:hypothetical protein